MAKQIGSQHRETLVESGMVLEAGQRRNARELVLVDSDGKRELYAKRDDFAGAVIEINGKGYEFVTSLPALPIR